MCGQEGDPHEQGHGDDAHGNHGRRGVARFGMFEGFDPIADCFDTGEGDAQPPAKARNKSQT